MVNVLTRGGSYAEAHALTSACNPATAEAVSGARVVHVPADHVIRCIRESPDIGLAMIAAASLHLHDLVQQIEQLKGQSGVAKGRGVSRFPGAGRQRLLRHCVAE